MTNPASSGPEEPPKPRPGSADPRPTPVKGTSLFTRVSAAWVAIAAVLLLLVLMIIFMLQNSTPVSIHYLGLTISLPLGMAIVIATVGGGVLVAIAGSARIAQLRRDARRGPQPPVKGRRAT